ncbi:hypothetical protein ACFV98_21265 [Streptomyces violascens]|uniref:hypothetical protein n=1 Tax=Streptomyces violascens TaxID=67381 RepID=UPI003653CB61
MIAGAQVDTPTARARLLRAEQEATEQHDRVGQTFAVQWLGQVGFLEGDWGRAIELLLRTRAAHGPKAALNPGPIPCRVTLAAAWPARGRTTEAMAVLDEARGLCEEASSPPGPSPGAKSGSPSSSARAPPRPPSPGCCGCPVRRWSPNWPPYWAR